LKFKTTISDISSSTFKIAKKIPQAKALPKQLKLTANLLLFQDTMHPAEISAKLLAQINITKCFKDQRLCKEEEDNHYAPNMFYYIYRNMRNARLNPHATKQ
jgi:hypothetical protein